MNKQSLLYMAPIGTFYDLKEDVIKNNLKRHEDLFFKDRELYTYLLYFDNAKYYSKSLIISNLLKNSLYKEDSLNEESLKIEDYLILKSLRNENITHSLKMLLNLKNDKINNNRTSKLILRFLFDRGNLDYICIKYKSKIKDLIIHALGLSTVNKILSGDRKLFDKKIGIYKNPFAYECLLFVFNKDYSFKSEYIKTYLQAKKIILNGAPLKIKKGIVPIEVLEGFVHDSKKFYNLNSLYEVSNISDKQAIQKQKILKDIEIKKEIDYTKLSSQDLIKLIYNGNLTETEKDKIYTELYSKIENIEKYFNDIEDIAFVFDFSLSLEGSKENKLNAFYKEIELYFSLLNKYKNHLFIVGGKENEDGLIYPMGDTNISRGVLDAFSKGFKKVIIVSDGFENVGNLDSIYKRLLQLELKYEILHLNPVFSAKSMDFKSFGKDISVVPFDKFSDLNYLELFSMLEFDSDLFKKTIKERILKEM